MSCDCTTAQLQLSAVLPTVCKNSNHLFGIQEASVTLDAFRSIYFLPSAYPDDSAVHSLLSTSQKAPISTDPAYESGRNSPTTSYAADDAINDIASTNVSRQPVPATSAPINDRSVLPEGYSTSPAVPSVTGGTTPVATAEIAVESTEVSSEQQNTTSSASMPAGRVAHSRSHSTSPSQQNVPAGTQTMTRQDVAAVHAWLSERVKLAKCGACVFGTQVFPCTRTVLLQDFMMVHLAQSDWHSVVNEQQPLK
jgi:hypothetical protein